MNSDLKETLLLNMKAAFCFPFLLTLFVCARARFFFPKYKKTRNDKTCDDFLKGAAAAAFCVFSFYFLEKNHRTKTNKLNEKERKKNS